MSLAIMGLVTANTAGIHRFLNVGAGGQDQRPFFESKVPNPPGVRVGVTSYKRAAGELSAPEPAVATEARNRLPSYAPAGSMSLRVGVALSIVVEVVVAALV
jgi:hypothetical protein